MADQVEIDVNVNVKDDGELGKFRKKIKDATKDIDDMGKTSGPKNFQKEVEKASQSIDKIGTEGKKAFKELSQSEKDAAVKFSMLDKNTQNLLKDMGSLSKTSFQQWGPQLLEAKRRFDEIDRSTTTWQGHLDYSKAKLQLLGVETESLGGKLKVVGTTIDQVLLQKWDLIRNKVSSVGNFISSKIGGALRSVRGMVNSVANSFSGIGGIVSSIMGALGVASFNKLTVSASMARERMVALTNAVMGSTKEGSKFVKVMDQLTDTSLVSLDDLGQAMSNVKMATGMSNDELQTFATTVNDIGQRAILMGKSGEEAISLMTAAGKGLNGEFNMLQDNFGITKDKLKSMGWSGAADDVRGYQKALNEALQRGGKMDDMLNTTPGKVEVLGKMFRKAGRQIGDMFIPYINQALDYIIQLTKAQPNLLKGVIAVTGAFSGFATVAPTIAPMLSVVDSLSGKFSKVGSVIVGASNVTNEYTRKARAFNTVAKTGEKTTVSLASSVGGLTSTLGVGLGAVLGVAAAVALLTYGFYELGKSMGWWTNFSTMIDSAKSAIERFWKAFTNHPDVQAFLAWIPQAFENLKRSVAGLIPAFVEAWNTIFPGTLSKDGDIVQTVINTVGSAWETLKGILQGLASVFQPVYDWMVKNRDIIMKVAEAVMILINPTLWLTKGFYELGKSFGWWKDVPTMLASVKDGLQRIWDSIANHPDLQDLIKQLQTDIPDALNFLKDVVIMVMGILGQFWNEIAPPDAQGKVDAVSGAITILSFVIKAFVLVIKIALGIIRGLYDAFKAVYDGVTFVSDALGGFGNFLSFLLGPISIVWEALKKIVCILIGCSPGIVPALLLVQQTFSSVLGAVVGIVTTYVPMIWGAFLSFLQTLASLPGRVWGILSQVIGRVATWASNLVSKATSTASSFVSNAINGVSSLPSKFASKLQEVYNKLVNWGKDMVNKAKEIFNSVANWVGQVTGLSSGFSGNFSGGFSGNFSSGFGSTSDTLNNTLSQQISNNNNKSSVTNNFSINGIIEEDAADFIVSKVNEHVRRQNLIRGV